MKPQLQAEGLPRKIIGYHRNEQSDWIAVLECGHQKHVQRDPPWTEPHWVTTAEGRQQHVGHVLPCSAWRNRRSDSLHGAWNSGQTATPDLGLWSSAPTRNR